eukprot:4307914-Amphidinium_carterae.1
MSFGSRAPRLVQMLVLVITKTACDQPASRRGGVRKLSVRVFPCPQVDGKDSRESKFAGKEYKDCS